MARVEQRFTTLAGVLLLWALPGAAFGRDHFVDNVAGDDRNDGGFERIGAAGSGPFRTLARALAAMGPGDRLSIAKTELPYRESVTLQGRRNSGLPSHPFTIFGNGALLDGRAAVPSEQWSHVGGDVYRWRASTGAFPYLFLDDQPARRRRIGRGVLPTSEPRAFEWWPHGGELYVVTEPARLPTAYAWSAPALPVGLTLYDVHDVVIQDLMIQGYQLDGVNAHDGVDRVEFVGVNCRANGRAGIHVGGASRVRIQGCSLADNGVTQLHVEGFSRTQLEDSALAEGPVPAIVVEGGRIERR